MGFSAFAEIWSLPASMQVHDGLCPAAQGEGEKRASPGQGLDPAAGQRLGEAAGLGEEHADDDRLPHGDIADGAAFDARGESPDDEVQIGQLGHSHELAPGSAPCQCPRAAPRVSSCPSRWRWRR